MKEFAASKIADGYDYVIMGHIHKPQVARLRRVHSPDSGTDGYFITLGDWIKHYTYGEFSNGKFELKHWAAAK
jgi:UDP-2,3-diacylglucosamine hydrolase